MKTRKLVAQEVVNGKRVVLGSDDKHPVMESKTDCIELIDSGIVTIGDVNSGFSVRRQRELRGAESKNDRIARSLGYNSWDVVKLEFGIETIGELIELAKIAKSVEIAGGEKVV
jgi:hypothetical protein